MKSLSSIVCEIWREKENQGQGHCIKVKGHMCKITLPCTTMHIGDCVHQI